MYIHTYIHDMYIKKKRNTTGKLREKHTNNKKKNRNTAYPAQDPTANIYHIFIRGGSRAGYPVFLLCCVFSRSFSCLFMFVMLLFNVVAYLFLSFCIYKRNNTYKNKTKHKSF